MDSAADIVDILVLIALLFSALFAMIRGFAREVLTLFAWGVSALIAWQLAPLGRYSFIQLFESFGYTPPGWLASTAPLFIIFIVSIILLFMMNLALIHRMKALGLGFLDHVLGFAFGAVRGLLILSVLYLFYGLFFPVKDAPQWHPEWLAESRTIPILNETVNLVVTLLPQDPRRVSNQRRRLYDLPGDLPNDLSEDDLAP